MCNETLVGGPVQPLPPGLSCPNPASPANGRVLITAENNRLVATYSCNRGFRLVRGQRVRFCQNDGTFSGRAPICVRGLYVNLNDKIYHYY